MSIGLVLVGTDGPDGLEGERVRRRGRRLFRRLILGAQEYQFALPRGQGGDELPGDEARERIFYVIPARTDDPALVQLVRRAHVPAEARGAGSRVLLAQRQQLAPQRPVAIQRPRRGTPGEAELEAAHLGSETRVGVGAVQARATDLHVRGG